VSLIYPPTLPYHPAVAAWKLPLKPVKPPNLATETGQAFLPATTPHSSAAGCEPLNPSHVYLFVSCQRLGLFTLSVCSSLDFCGLPLLVCQKPRPFVSDLTRRSISWFVSYSPRGQAYPHDGSSHAEEACTTGQSSSYSKGACTIGYCCCDASVHVSCCDRLLSVRRRACHRSAPVVCCSETSNSTFHSIPTPKL
jgi:hypothetical protein